MAVATAVVLLGACGGEGEGESGAATLPPIASTTTTTIPVTTTTEYVPIFHEIQSGDVLANIAAQYGVDYDELIALNGIVPLIPMFVPGMQVEIAWQAHLGGFLAGFLLVQLLWLGWIIRGTAA